MKFYLPILVLWYCSFSVNCQTENSDGFKQFFYENGKVSSEGWIREGKPDSLWKNYYLNGKLKSIGIRKNFLLDSVWVFYEEMGNKTEEISYLKGKRSGYCIKYQTIVVADKLQTVEKARELYLEDRKQGQAFYFNRQGKIDQIIRYKDGKKHGLSRQFNTDSLIQIIYKYHNDFLIDREFINQTDNKGLKQGVWRSYFDNDNIKLEENYKDGLLNGYYREYNERGRQLISRYYEKGSEIESKENTEIKVEIRNQYDAQGNVISSGGYINNTPVGIHRVYTDNKSIVKTKEYSDSGQIVAEGNTDDKGQMEEFWQFYFPGGQLRSEGNFVNNKRDGKWKYYFPSGQLEQTGTYRDGLEEGEWTWYFEDASVRRVENYFRGREDGPSVEYDQSGTIIAKGEFIEGLEEGKWYYHSGDHTETGSFKNGLRDGLWQYFYLSGEKKFLGSFVQGYSNGKHRYYYLNGKISEEQYFEMGIKQRIWRKFDEEGNVLMSYTYENDVLTKINGIKVSLETEK